VFTARYALSPYIKQIRFVFKGLIVRPVETGTYSVCVLEIGSVLQRYIYLTLGFEGLRTD
jgi:hypothetical protein